MAAIFPAPNHNRARCSQYILTCVDPAPEEDPQKAKGAADPIDVRTYLK